MPVYWPGGARRRDGVSLVCGSCMEREKAGVDTAGPWGSPGGERERVKAETGALSTVACTRWRTGS